MRIVIWQNVAMRLSLLLLLLAVSLPTFSQQNTTIKNYLESADKYELEGQYKEATRQLNNAAMKMWEDREYEEAITYFNRSIELNKKIDNYSGIAKLNSNLGMIYSDLGQYQKSLDYFDEALSYRLKNGQRTEIISTFINQAVVLNNLKRHQEAADALEKALQLATEMSDATQMKSCYGMLAETFEKAGDEERTLYYFNLYKTFHEMIQRERVKEAQKETETAKLRALQLELEKKEEQIALLKVKEELKSKDEALEKMDDEVSELLNSQTKQQLANNLLQRKVEIDELRIAEETAKNETQKAWNIIIIVGLIVSLLVIALVSRNYVLKKRINNNLAAKNEEIIALNNSLEAEVSKRTSELETALENLRKRNRDLDQFSHVIAHNLRGPVARILGLGKVINMKNPADPVNLEIFGRLVDSAQNLDDVVNDLSTILNIKDNYELSKEPIDIQKSIKQVEDLLQEEIRESNAKIIAELKVDSIFGVKTYIESILYNLLSNSIKYSTDKNTPEIHVSVSNGADTYKLAVKDNGIGISSNNFSKVFEPYNRLTSDGKGKGLGLYLVKTQAEAMGGTVKVASEEGKGAEFIVEIPISKS